MPSNNQEEESVVVVVVKNQVREALRSTKTKLWEPPYVNSEGQPNVRALERLAAAWKTNHILKIENVASVVRILQEWQSHALAKLASKQRPNRLDLLKFEIIF